MAIAGWGWDRNWVRQGRLTAGSQVTGLDVGQLQNDQGQASSAWQTVGTTSWLRVDAGAAVPWRALLLARTNLTSAAQTRWRVGPPEAFVLQAAALDLDATSPGFALPAGVALTRAHSPAGAMATRWTGAAWAEVAADLPRQDFDPVAGDWSLLQEPERTNVLPNPRGLGAASGTWATGWNASAVADGLTVTPVGLASEAGMTGIDIRIQGTLAAAGAACRINFQGTGGPDMAVAAGGRAALSAFVRRVSGTVPSGGAFRSTGAAADLVAVGAAPDALQRAVASFTYPAAITSSALAYIPSFPAGAVDCVLRLLWPQAEVGDGATSPILPPAGGTGASTRGAEQLARAFGAGLAAGFTIMAERRVDAAPAAASELHGIRLRNGTSTANAAWLYLLAGAPLASQVRVRTGAVYQATLNSPALALGTTYRHVLSAAQDAINVFRDGALEGQDTSCDVVALRNLTIYSGEGVVRLRRLRVYLTALRADIAANLSATGEARAPYAYDSGTIPAGVVPGIGQSLTVTPAEVSGQVCLCDIIDPTNPDGFLNVALAYAGPLVQTRRNFSYGSAVGRAQGGTTVRTRSGATIPRLDWVARRWTLQMEAIGRDEVWPFVMALDLHARRGGNVLFVPDPDGPDAAREAVFGTLTPTSDVTLKNYAQRDWRATIEERL